MGNHMVSNSASAINATDDISTVDPDESILSLAKGPRRRQHDDESADGEEDDLESLTSAAQGQKQVEKREEEKELPPHACAYDMPFTSAEFMLIRIVTVVFTTLPV